MAPYVPMASLYTTTGFIGLTLVMVASRVVEWIMVSRDKTL